MSSRYLHLWHPAQNNPGFTLNPGRVSLPVIAFWGGQNSRQPGGLARVQLVRRDAKIMLGCRFNAKYADAPLGDIQVDLQNALLVPQHLDHQGNDQLLRFANIASVRRQE